ncbi:uncharacterized protein LOC109862603 [Pseudomyrmex gracilis]|uniref:uncharacterized protein LOC109862603 n=1 Tax=Pseudomyrmex gracilis TaxID=219809 RepID=UPI0009955BDC|nr:uncharacterized protein LOC109862603 [Pseudomyrmex gracilis]
MSSRKIYDVTPEQREVLLWKDAKRKQLREMYLKDAGHPTKSLLFDTGIYRYAAAKATVELNFVPTVVNYITRMGFVFGLIGLLYWNIKTTKAKEEHLYRTGQISYADRHGKFC